MVRIDVTEDEDKKEEFQKESEKPVEEKEDDAAGEKKEIPLEKMTKAKLLKKCKAFQEEVASTYDLFLRSQAEIENTKKRYQKEKEGLVKYANESLIKQLLVVVDNLEQAITHFQQNCSSEAILEGVELTHKALMDILKKGGVEEVDAVNKPFNPNFHEAMCEQEDPEVEPGIVLQEFQKGYLLNQRLIRPAKVIVNKTPK